MKEVIIKLQSLGILKFGSFEVAKDFIAPYQIDFSIAISHAELAKAICLLLWEKAEHLPFDLLCGVPPFGASLASYIAWEHNKTLVLRRSDIKERGMAPKIAGKFKSAQRCLLIQDALKMGQQTLDLVDELEEEGLKVGDVLAFIDLELGAKQKLKRRGVIPHCVTSMSEISQILFDAGKIPGDRFKLISDFLEKK